MELNSQNEQGEFNSCQDSTIIVATMTLHFRGSSDQYQVSSKRFCRHAEELARIDYNQKGGYSQDNTDARSPVSWRVNNWLTHAPTNRLPDNWTRTLALSLFPFVFAFSSRFPRLTASSARYLLAKIPKAPRNLTREAICSFYHDKCTEISLLCFKKMQLIKIISFL